MFWAKKQVGLHCRHNRSLGQSHREFWNLWLPQSGARGLGVYRPPLTIHWIQAALWARCFFSAKNSPGGAILDVVWYSALSSQLSTRLVAEGGSGSYSIASIAPHFVRMKRCIKDPQKNSNVFYTFCTFKMLIDVVKFLSKKLEPFILLSAMYENAYFPTS